MVVPGNRLCETLNKFKVNVSQPEPWSLVHQPFNQLRQKNVTKFQQHVKHISLKSKIYLEGDLTFKELDVLCDIELVFTTIAHEIGVQYVIALD